MVTEEKQIVIDAVIEQLKIDFKQGDFTVLDELLGFVPIKRLIGALPEELWSKYTPPKFVPYIQEVLIPYSNGITEHVRKYFRTRTVYEWMAPKISFGAYTLEWTSTFDRFRPDYWKGEGYYTKLITGETVNPLEFHYGNDGTGFLLNLLSHFKTKDELIQNIDRWANYYRKHVTDRLSGIPAAVLYADIHLQRSGLSDGIKQQYTNHTLAEIESSNVEEYYYFKYDIFDDHIDFYLNPVYKTWKSVILYIK